MGEMRSALVKATRALDAELALRDNLQPLRDALGEALDIEKYMDAQRAEKDALDIKIGSLLAQAKQVDEIIAKGHADLEASRIAARSLADSRMAEVRANGDRIIADARAKDEKAAQMLAEARSRASAIVTEAEAVAKNTAAGKTDELANLDAKIAAKRDELGSVTAEVENMTERLAGVKREMAQVKARLG